MCVMKAYVPRSSDRALLVGASVDQLYLQMQPMAWTGQTYRQTEIIRRQALMKTLRLYRPQITPRDAKLVRFLLLTLPSLQ